MSFNFTVKIHGGNENQPESNMELQSQGNQIKSAASQTCFRGRKNRPKETKVSKDETKISASKKYITKLGATINIY